MSEVAVIVGQFEPRAVYLLSEPDGVFGVIDSAATMGFEADDSFRRLGGIRPVAEIVAELILNRLPIAAAAHGFNNRWSFGGECVADLSGFFDFGLIGFLIAVQVDVDHQSGQFEVEFFQ